MLFRVRIFIGLAPNDWSQQLRALGFMWRRSEPQPMADQVLLDDCYGPWGELPVWAERLGAR